MFITSLPKNLLDQPQALSVVFCELILPLRLIVQNCSSFVGL
jgi:hypothetical protein